MGYMQQHFALGGQAALQIRLQTAALQLARLGCQPAGLTMYMHELAAALSPESYLALQIRPPSVKL